MEKEQTNTMEIKLVEPKREKIKKQKKKKVGFIKTLLLTGQITRLLVILCTVAIMVILFLLGFLSILGVVKMFFSATDFIVFAVLAGTGIYGFYEYFRLRRIYKIDSIFPNFVRDLAESRRAGMTFTKAILFASKGNYGILTPEIQKISQQVSWGSGVTDALIGFSQRVKTKSIQRTISLIIEASKSGGNVADVLDVAAKDAREIKMLETERKTNMASYVIVIYVGMFVFLAIVGILCVKFIPAMTGSGMAGLGSAMGSGGGGSSVNPKDITAIFYFASLVQGFGSGFVAGVFEDGNFTSGVKHVFIMVLSSWIMFKLFMGV
jgi:flagellar protein FlaJ